MFIVLKKKTIIIALIIIAAVAVCAIAGGICVAESKTASVGQKVIVIDAGHGGSDRGVVGKNGTEEADKNLEISFMLKDLLEDAGFFVIMTRTTDDGADEAGSFKQEDFTRRKNIIEKSEPDMVLSIHCNKFPSSDRRGAQVFFNDLSEEGRILADILQGCINSLNAANVGRVFDALPGEYFMLNCTHAPSVIVECGFLSNPQDEELLCNKDYLDKFVYSIYDGVVAYFENS